MPPGNPEAYGDGYGELLRILEGQNAPAEDPGLGVGGVLTAGGLLAGGGLAARRFAPNATAKVTGGARTLLNRVPASGRAAEAVGNLSSRVGSRASAAGARVAPWAQRAGTTAKQLGTGWGPALRSAPVRAAGLGAVAAQAAITGGQFGTKLYDEFEPYRDAIGAIGGDFEAADADDRHAIAMQKVRSGEWDADQAIAYQEGGDGGLNAGQEWLGRVGALLTGNVDQAFGRDYQAHLEQSREGGWLEQQMTGRGAAAADPAGGATAAPAALGAPEEEQDDLGRVLSMLEDRAVGVEQDYQDRVGELREHYQLAETPEERAALQYALGTLEAQRQAGHTVIQNAYGQAMADNAARSQQVRDAASRQAADVQAIYGDASAGVQGIIGDAEGQYADSGLGVGATDVSGNVTDWVPLIEGEGARSAALAGQLGQIAADDMAFLGSALAGEQGAQQGDLERLALTYGTQATMDHNRRVQDRVAAERMALADQTARAQEFYDTRRYGLDDTAIQMALDLYASGQQGNQPMIPSDPQGAYIAGLDMLSQYGTAALPFIANNGLIPPEELAVILQSMGAVGAQPAG